MDRGVIREVLMGVSSSVWVFGVVVLVTRVDSRDPRKPRSRVSGGVGMIFIVVGIRLFDFFMVSGKLIRF